MPTDFPVRNRYTGEVQFTAQIECDENASDAVKLGLAAVWAVKNGVSLCRAYMRGADMRDANMRDADMRGADMRDANMRDAYMRGANMRDADMRGANMRDANMRDADMRNTDMRGAIGIEDRIIDGGLRSDGYRFLLTRTDPGEWRIKAGCRNFTVTEAAAHWDKTRPPGEALGDETRLIIDHMVAVAKLRGWPEEGEKEE